MWYLNAVRHSGFSSANQAQINKCWQNSPQNKQPIISHRAGMDAAGEQPGNGSHAKHNVSGWQRNKIYNRTKLTIVCAWGLYHRGISFNCADEWLSVVVSKARFLGFLIPPVITISSSINAGALLAAGIDSSKDCAAHLVPGHWQPQIHPPKRLFSGRSGRWAIYRRHTPRLHCWLLVPMLCVEMYRQWLNVIRRIVFFHHGY